MSHEFGGHWTEAKLAILASYLSAYTKALKKQPFDLVYIDAFAGTGSRQPRGHVSSSRPLFNSDDEFAPPEFLDGSARIALRTEPPFSNYIFIEQNEARCSELRRLENEFPGRSGRVDVRHGDANQVVRDLCREDWRRRRAVLFLDPYGMQVDWATLEAVAATRAIDLWLLFPLGIGVLRLLMRSGKIPEAWQAALDRVFGTPDWRWDLYEVQVQPGLFEPIPSVQRATPEAIGRYVLGRLETLFAGVAPEPKVLRNSSNNPLYLLCFAAANPRGAKIALRIATHLLL